MSERTCSKWVARYRAEGEAGLLDRSSAPAWSPTAPTSTPSRRSRRCGGCASPARRSPSCSTGRCSTVSGILTRIGMGKLGRLGLEPAERYERAVAGRADPHRRQEARPHPRRRRQTHHRQQHATPAPIGPIAAGRAQDRRLGLRPHRDRRRHPPGLRRGPPRRESHHRDRLPAPRDRVLCKLRHDRRASC